MESQPKNPEYSGIVLKAFTHGVKRLVMITKRLLIVMLYTYGQTISTRTYKDQMAP